MLSFFPAFFLAFFLSRVLSCFLSFPLSFLLPSCIFERVCVSLCTRACVCVRAFMLASIQLGAFDKERERARERRIIRIEQENQQIKKEKKRVEAEKNAYCIKDIHNDLCAWVVVVVVVVCVVAVVFPLLLIHLSPRAFHYVHEAEALERWVLVGLEP